jgi:signal transduction histidine kinase
MKWPRIKSSKLIIPIAAFCLATIALIWTNYFHQKNTDKKDTIASAVQRNNNLAVALEQYAVRTIHTTDAVLRMVKMDYDERGDAINIDQLLYSNAVNSDIFNGVAIINEKGEVAHITNRLTSRAGLNFSDREYFKFHSQHNSDTLLISKPLVSKIRKKTVLIFSRRINKKDGSFGGVVAIQTEPHTFTSFYAQANLRKNDIISLIAPDGITYARRTGTIESCGENIIKSPLFRHVANNPDSFYLAADAIRGIPTYFSYRKLKKYPVIATVGTSQQDVLEDYYKRAQRDFTSSVIISALVILFYFMICLVLRHRKKMADKLIAEQQKHQRQVTEEVIAAQEREREEIGHELHDNVNQVLTTVKLYLELALHKPEMREELIGKSMDLVSNSITEIRNLSHDLSAPTLGTGSLIDSIYALTENVSTSTGIRISFDHSSCHTLLSMDQKLAIYRIVQEQLNNVVKHARASAVWITISQRDGHTTVVIKDNGKGFNTVEKRNGIGLNNIISRTKVFNGTADIESVPGNGCRLLVNLPIIHELQKLEPGIN